MIDRPFGLTRRQFECLRLASEHRTSKEIATRLGLSPHTVDSHIDLARVAMKAPDRATAARMLAAYLVESASEPTTDQLTGHPPPVAPPASPEPSRVGQDVAATMVLGRRVSLGPWVRIGIVFGIAAASIFAVVLLMVAGDVIARRQAQPAITRSANP